MDDARNQIHQRLLVLIHAVVQVCGQLWDGREWIERYLILPSSNSRIPVSYSLSKGDDIIGQNPLFSFISPMIHCSSPVPLPFFHVPDLTQALLACGLLQLAPFKPRTVGLLGVVASAMNCYFLLPAYPKLPAAPKPKVA